MLLLLPTNTITGQPPTRAGPDAAADTAPSPAPAPAAATATATADATPATAILLLLLRCCS